MLLLFFTCNTKSMCLTCTTKKQKTDKKSLHYAAQKGNKKRIKKLLRQHTDIDTENNDGETPLFVAIKHDQKDAAAILLKNGADPNRCNKEGETPLEYTIINELPKCAILLLEKDANTNIGKHNLESDLVAFYGESPSDEKIKENYKFIVPVHSYLLRRKLTPLYELQQNEQRPLNQTTLPLSNSTL